MVGANCPPGGSCKCQTKDLGSELAGSRVVGGVAGGKRGGRAAEGECTARGEGEELATAGAVAAGGGAEERLRQRTCQTAEGEIGEDEKRGECV